MSNEIWINAVKNSRQGDDNLFNKIVASSYKKDFYEPILVLVKDSSLVEEIYIQSVTKFWERFVLAGEKLPDSNINGYIFQMAKNAFFEIKRKNSTAKAGMFVSVDATEIYKTYSTHIVENREFTDNTIETDNVSVLQSVIKAMSKLDELCFNIIEKNILENISLKSVIEELTLEGTYNSIVKKKRRCIQKLKNLLNAEMISNAITLQEFK